MKPLLKPSSHSICTTLRCGHPLLGCLLETKLLVWISVSGLSCGFTGQESRP